MQKQVHTILSMLFPNDLFPGKTWEVQQARFLHGILVIVALAILLLLGVRRYEGLSVSVSDAVLFSLVIVNTLLFIALRCGSIQFAQFCFIVLTWWAMAFLTFTGQGLADTAFAAQLATLVTSALLLSKRTTIALATLTVCEVWLLMACHYEGWVLLHTDTPFGIARDYTVVIILITVIVLYYIHILQKSRIQLIHELDARQRAEQALVQVERMAAIGTLTMGVAHQFNNINTSVLGYTELAMQDPKLTPFVKDHLARVRDASLRSRDITNSLLFYSNQIGIAKERTNLSHLTAEVLDHYADEIKTHAIFLKNHLVPIPDCEADIEKVRQIIAQLLENALHALIDCTEQIITVETGQDGADVWLQISDTGCGISPEEQRVIFTPFFSTKGEHAAPGAPQAKVRGVGLGLSVAQTVAKRHGGEIELRSEPRRGTTVRLRMPAITAAESFSTDMEKAASPSQSNSPEDSRSILIIEHDPNVREYLVKVLAIDKHNVRTAATAAEGLATASQDTCDMILLESQMPDQSALDFLHNLQKTGVRRIPAILLLAGSIRAQQTVEVIRATYPDAFVDMVCKPVEIELLRRTVQQLLVTASQQG